ncbi:hypothetical protein Tco_0656379 [Tanacetum coccineum]|uniref:Uncharacterized protein n=1 Tax=Tanacetum coccineum TaxID=301880 RepID=A0ABQ4X992_9ASTR
MWEMEQMIAKAVLQERGNIQAKIFSQIQKAIDNHIPSQVDALVRSYMSGHISSCSSLVSITKHQSVPDQTISTISFHENVFQLQQQELAIWLGLQIKFKNLFRESWHIGKKDIEYDRYMSGESSSVQVNEEERGLSTLGNQEQVDDYDFWTDSYSSDDDEIPTKQVSQDIMEEVSLTIDEAKLKKIADEMLRQRCTSRDEHQYHIDQMKNFLKSDIVWESRKEILISPHPQKTTPLVQSCQRDPEAPALSLINQDLLYLKKGSLGPEKIVLSLHKFLVIISNDDDIEERTFRWEKQKRAMKNKGEVLGPMARNRVLLWSLSVFIRSSVIWERVHDFQLGIESYQ